MFDHTVPYGFGLTVVLPHEIALAQVKDALEAEGFGVLSEIDLARTLRHRVGADVHGYVILGACFPRIAAAALQAEPDIGLLLPCNVIVYATDDPERSRVVAIDPVAALGVTGNPALQPLAAEVSEHLARALKRLPSVTPELVEVAEEIC